jgi:methylated-DNA-[protein]-cysteine S-methyltransferase
MPDNFLRKGAIKMERYVKHMPSPIGILSLYASDTALVGLYMGNQDKESLHRKYQHVHEHESAILTKAAEELKAFFAGKLKIFTVPVEVSGTDFQKAVWKNLQGIVYGELRTYADVARSIFRPSAVRAVGGAIGSNPVSIIIPCHRVIGSDDSLTGFGGGLPVKKRLLEIEGHVIRDFKLDKSRS